jgi:hypothetical protein
MKLGAEMRRRQFASAAHRRSSGTGPRRFCSARLLAPKGPKWPAFPALYVIWGTSTCDLFCQFRLTHTKMSV